MVKKTQNTEFTEFRSNEKPAYKTLKIPLKTILLNRDTVQPIVTNLVFVLSDLVIHAYQFIRLYILHCVVVKQQKLPTIDETFIIYCIKTLGTRDARGVKCKNTVLAEELKRFYEAEYQPLLNHEKTNLKNMPHMLPYIATQIHTAFHNNIQEHFVQHLLRFINKTTPECKGEDKETLFQFKKRILEISDVTAECRETEPTFSDWKRDHLSNILPNSGKIEKSIHYDVKVRPFDYLRGMIYMNSVLEKSSQRSMASTGGGDAASEVNGKLGNKLFQPIPLRTNIIPKHITLDTASVIYYFKPKVTDDGETVKKDMLLKAVKKYQEAVWGEILNLKHSVFRNRHYQFNHQIQTDGVSCCLLFMRKDLKATKNWGSKLPTVKEQEFHAIEAIPKEQLETLKGRNVVGCDPGKRSLVYMMDGSGKKLQYTAPQRRRESKAEANQRILLVEKRRNGIIEKETKVSEYNSKSVNYDAFKAYLVEKNKLNADASEFYKREVWRKMKFRQYSYGKKSIDTFLNKIQETFGANIVIGYGNWSQGSGQMKFLAPTMNKGLRKAIHRRYDTVSINECYTSQKCCGCHNDLAYYYTKEGKEVRRLQTCSNCVSYPNKQTVFRTRDANSAVNIMQLTSSWIAKQERPLCFQHKQT